ncbi:MAG TPA: glycine cleavage T C-terminal barrel domain-containing protein [Polyangiaceae bacterium]|nr:glycine cleavage T C-terminal barrel domain-containing protein [Polyangiaceae bacterium]
MSVIPDEGPPEPVLVVLQPARGTLSVTGAEAKSWLNGLVTCDVLKVAPGQGAFGLALNKQGKIQSEIEVVAAEQGLLVGISPGVSQALLAALDKFLVMEDAELSDVTSGYQWADFHGLAAATLAEAAAKACGGSFAIMNFTAQSGATLVFERESLLELQRFIERTPALRLGSDADWEVFRITEVLGRFGVDFGETDNPHEAALDRRAVSWSKGCYLGQEVVCMQDMRGKLKRRLVALQLDTAGDLPQAGSPVTTNDGAEAVGELTSVARSPVTGRAVALARLKSPYFEGKEALGVAGMKAAFVQQGPTEIG